MMSATLFARRSILATLLFLSVTPAAAQTMQTAARRRTPRVITNKELEPLRLKREAQEAEYERTHRERGMPSKEELRRRLEEHDRRLGELAREMEAEQMEAELRELREELAGVRRQLDALNFQHPPQAAAYGPAYALPSYYPYFYGPTFGHRGRFGRGNFGLQPGFGRWPHGRRSGHSAPIYVNPSRHAPTRPPMVHAPGGRRR